MSCSLQLKGQLMKLLLPVYPYKILHKGGGVFQYNKKASILKGVDMEAMALVYHIILFLFQAVFLSGMLLFLCFLLIISCIGFLKTAQLFLGVLLFLQIPARLLETLLLMPLFLPASFESALAVFFLLLLLIAVDKFGIAAEKQASLQLHKDNLLDRDKNILLNYIFLEMLRFLLLTGLGILYLVLL